MEILINKSIQDKADKILLDIKQKADDKIAKQQYIDLCIKTKICPICGDELNSRKVSKEEKEKYNYDYYNDTLECNKEHYTLVQGEYLDDDYD